MWRVRLFDTARIIAQIGFANQAMTVRMYTLCMSILVFHLTLNVLHLACLALRRIRRRHIKHCRLCIFSKILQQT